MKPVAIVSGYERVHLVRWPHYAESHPANTARAESLARAYAAGKVKRVIVCHTSCPTSVVRVLRKHGVQPLSWGEDVQKLALQLPEVLARSGFRPPALEPAVERNTPVVDLALLEGFNAPPPEPEPKPDAPPTAAISPPRRPREWEDEDITALLEAIRYAEGDAARFVEGYHLQRERIRPALQLYTKLVEVAAQRGLELDPGLLRGLRILAGLESPPPTPAPTPLPATQPAVDVTALVQAVVGETLKAAQQPPPPRPRGRPPLHPRPHGGEPAAAVATASSPPLQQPAPPPPAIAPSPIPPAVISPRADGLRRLRDEVHEAVQSGALSKACAFDVLALLDQERSR